ncbi:glutamate decarboxylase [Vibrio penaeicida]|uniref:glutamate decarboxylase n=1 Tax=Vibrio penaeicida TaxID=104609 RepID=UPI0027332D0D|nr:glutamate decarboxylase [Vibrio penaeicida]MDP2574450.1 glutamate decarboxylase [Vibrio penaeicida]
MGNQKDIKFQTANTPTYGRSLFREETPNNKMPEMEHDPQVVYRFIRDELQLDGNPTLNMASFVTTVMDEEANQLIKDNLGKNYIDGEVYNRTLEIEQRCVRMLLDLFNAPNDMKTAEELAHNKDIPSGWGTVAIGSSEALMLCALSHKEQWKKNRKAKGLSYDRPNIVIGSDVHITWVKYAQYFDVDIKWIPITEETNYVITAEEVRKAVDENTTCVVAVMGTSYTGQNDPVEAINNVLVELKNHPDPDCRLDVPLHVDGASGGFIEPFRDHSETPELKWDFKLEQVKTMNVSGHKFGLVYPGVGWALWKDFHEIPEKLFVTTNVLGFDESTYSLNFSRGSSMVLAQYYNFLRLGKHGYSAVVQNLMSLAQDLSAGLGSLRLTVTEQDKEAGDDAPMTTIFENKPIFEVVNHAEYFPASAVRLNLTYDDQPLTNDDTKNYIYSVHDVSDKLKQFGWVVPAFSMPLEKRPPTQEQIVETPQIAVMRMVVKEGISRDMVGILIQNYIDSVIKLEEQVRAIQDSTKTYKATVTFDADSAKSASDLVEKASVKVTYLHRSESRERSVIAGAK